MTDYLKTYFNFKYIKYNSYGQNRGIVKFPQSSQKEKKKILPGFTCLTKKNDAYVTAFLRQFNMGIS